MLLALISFLLLICLERAVLICDFHREKAWNEWMNKVDNCVVDEKDVVLPHLRAIANAASLEECAQAEESQKRSHDWRRTSNFNVVFKINGYLTRRLDVYDYLYF